MNVYNAIKMVDLEENIHQLSGGTATLASVL